MFHRNFIISSIISLSVIYEPDSPSFRTMFFVHHFWRLSKNRRFWVSRMWQRGQLIIFSSGKAGATPSKSTCRDNRLYALENFDEDMPLSFLMIINLFKLPYKLNIPTFYVYYNFVIIFIADLYVLRYVVPGGEGGRGGGLVWPSILVRFVLASNGVFKMFDLYKSMRKHRISLCSEKRGGVISRHEGTSATFLRNNARPIIHRGCCTPRRIYLSWFVRFRVATIHYTSLLVRPCTVPHRGIIQNFDSVHLIGLLDYTASVFLFVFNVKMRKYWNKCTYKTFVDETNKFRY